MLTTSEIIAREIGTREIFDNNYANKHYTDKNSINSGNNVDNTTNFDADLVIHIDDANNNKFADGFLSRKVDVICYAMVQSFHNPASLF